MSPLTKRYPTFLFPLFNEPLIEHNINSLVENGVEELIIASSDNVDFSYVEYLKEKNNGRIKLHLYKEKRPRGTAGILTDIMPLLENQPFLVANSSLYIGNINFKGLFDFQHSKKAVATVCVKRKNNKGFESEESIALSPEKLLKEIHVIHHSKDRRSPWVSSGIYLFTPAVFEFIDPQKYFDIKEQLIPLMQKASLPVYGYELNGYSRSINNIEDYFGIHRDLFGINGKVDYFKDKEEVTENVWVGKNTVISPAVYLMGPIVIGSNCNIAGGAQIIGPAVIGNECRISENVILRESILWRGVSLGKRAKSEYCVVDEGLKISGDERISNLILVGDLRVGDINLTPLHYGVTAVGGKNLSQQVNKWCFNFIKRTLDIFISLILFLILLPLLFLIALLIKADLAGPVFFIQKRCGKDGKLFNMYKFRTMFADAEKKQAELAVQKNTDGPMFKMIDDPRITRFGKILRETSLDELPQLINVIKGEMSLVGPRPLIMDEMKFSPSWRNIRLKVKPGITGLWQIQGRSESPFHDWIRYDINYVKNQSLWLDLKILFKTISVVFKKGGAY
ncbi:MAG: sugar transferase [Candidatus Schekmanbacteria bacterium]|nr:sugar transferase [Candidatus Schekmanbacteria bacterium]